MGSSLLPKADALPDFVRIVADSSRRMKAWQDFSSDRALEHAVRSASPSQPVSLHALVVIALSYQLLFSETAALSFELKELLVMGLFVSVGLLRMVPDALWSRRGALEALVVGDTAITSVLLYVGGAGASDLYLVYFLIILIAAFSGSLRQGFLLGLVVSAAYAMAGLLSATDSMTSHLMRLPVLVIMTVFYGVTASRAKLESIRVRRLEEELRVSDQMRHSQKMETVAQLTSGLAHDFNNMLTVISGQAELVLMSLEETNPLRHELEEIRTAVEHASLLTRQVLTFSRTPLSEPKLVDVAALVTRLGRMVRRVLGEQSEVATVIGEAPGPVWADPAQLEQLILNLVLNARDAMPDGGTLTMEVRNVELKQPLTTAHAPLAPGRYVVLAVRDTGLGMEGTVQERIFEPFFTTKLPGKGTGLGLSSAYAIVRQCGGGIVVHSAPGRGSSFVVYLPRSDVS